MIKKVMAQPANKEPIQCETHKKGFGIVRNLSQKPLEYHT